MKNIARPISLYRVIFAAMDAAIALGGPTASPVLTSIRRKSTVPNAARKFRDPVYNYIYASVLENTIIQHPLMNRLHEIRQNATTYLTYPSAHGMRFSHSLGTMHVAGLLISSALQSADRDIRDELSRQVENALATEGRVINKMGMTLFGEESLLETDALYRQYHFVPLQGSGPQSLTLLVLFQAVRLACLVHDIGHPPFSHTVEAALNQALPGRYVGHEQIGLKIVDSIIRRFPEHPLKEFAAAVFVITKMLVDHKEPLSGVAKVVSGDLDADRIDYVRRDMLAAGLSPTAYDLGRLLDATILRRNPKSQAIEVAFTTGALSMIEAFFYARFHLYHYMLWHHNVVRTNLALSRSLFILLTSPSEKLPTAASHLSERLKDLATITGDPSDYEDFTDGSLVTQLRQLLITIEKIQKELAWSGQSAEQARVNSDDAKTLHLGLRLFLRRQTALLPALWKRPDQYHDFAAQVLAHYSSDSENVNAMKDLNKQLDRAFDHFRESSSDEKVRAPAAYANDYANKRFCLKIEEALSQTSVETKGEPLKLWAYFVTPRFKPTPKPGFALVSPTRGRDLDLPTLSPTVASLDDAWMQLPHLWLYVESEEGRAIDLRHVREIVADRLARFLKAY